MALLNLHGLRKKQVAALDTPQPAELAILWPNPG